MFFLADSGSTKTDWRLVDDEKKIHQCSTVGFNPYFHNMETISEILKRQLIPNFGFRISDFGFRIFFYGAGCSNNDKCEIVKLAIQKNFRNANIEVHHDLLGAARALCGHEEGIAAILGTGSNSC